MLELVIVGLQLIVGNAPVLAGAVVGKLLLSIAFLSAAAGLEVPGQETPPSGHPMYARPTHAFAGLEGAHFAHRKRGLGHGIAESNGLSRQVLQNIAAVRIVFQFVMRIGHGEVLLRIHHPATLQPDYAQACHGQFLAEDRAGHAHANHYHINRLEFDDTHSSFSQGSAWPSEMCWA
ncbi:MAG: hypothetical protein JW384_01513 [Nitrosomonadaceae bacterium]|nr:hypothetical protein [Nitrosomonadaceae bacterium]